MRAYKILVAANAMAAYGNFLNLVTLGLFTYQTTGSALHTGLFMALRLGSGFLAGFVAGGIANRHSRKNIIVHTGLIQAASMAALFMAPTGSITIVLYSVAVTMGIAGTLSAVALRSAIPEIVGSEHRVRANSLLAASRSVAMVAGFASSGMIIAWFDYVTVFSVNTATFALSSLIVAFLPIRTNSTAPTPDQPSIMSSHRTALAYLAANPIPAGLMVVRTLIGLASAAANVSIPIHSSTLDPAHPEAFMTQFWTIWAVGNILIQYVINRYSDYLKSAAEAIFIIAACTMSVASIGIFSDIPLALALSAGFITGAASGTAETSYQSRLQEAPDSHRGYLFGLSITSENLSFAIGMVVSALLLDTISPFLVVTSIALLAVAAVAVFVSITRKRLNFHTPTDVTI